MLDPNDQVINSSNYLSKLVSMGIYNFTKNIDAIAYLIDNPNTYKDVANFQLLGNNNFQEEIDLEEFVPRKKNTI